MPRVAAIVYSYYPQDPRPLREAEALAEAGNAVDMICMRLPDGKESSGAFAGGNAVGQPTQEVINGVKVYRISAMKTQGGKMSYLLDYLRFIFLAFLKVSALHFRNRYDVVHVHNMPDILVFAALIPKLCGSRIILDLHDPMPELYMTKYGLEVDSAIIRVLKVLEKLSIRFADMVITPNIAFRNLFIARGCPQKKIHIVMNAPMERLFQKDEVEEGGETGESFTLMFHGGVFERHGLDTALEAVSMLRGEIPGISLKVFGGGDFVAQFLSLIEQYRLQNAVTYHGVVSWDSISEHIASVDVGIIPNKRSPFTNINLPVRIFEYLCMGKPVIVPKTPGILDYFDSDSMFFFEPGDAASLAGAIRQVCREPARRQDVVARGFEVYVRHRWEVQQQHFQELVAALVPGAGTAASAATSDTRDA